MGIKNIKKLLEKYDNVIRTEPVSKLVGSRIAVDTPIYLCKHLYVTLKDHFDTYSDSDILSFKELSSKQSQLIIEEVVDRFIDNFNGYSSTTGAEFIMILEGESIPSDKERYAGIRRQQDHDRIVQRYEQYQRNRDVVGMRKVIVSATNIRVPELTRRLIEQLQDSFDYIIAEGESERTACELRESGMVDHILSTDTDCLAMGHSMITHIHSSTLGYTIVDYQQALEELELSESQFVDLCIMCGCDYNNNIPRVGVMTAYKLIQKHDTIENIGQVKDISHLNHESCRELFCLTPR